MVYMGLGIINSISIYCFWGRHVKAIKKAEKYQQFNFTYGNLGLSAGK